MSSMREVIKCLYRKRNPFVFIIIQLPAATTKQWTTSTTLSY